MAAHLLAVKCSCRRKNPAAGGKVKTQKQLLPAARCSVKKQKTPAAGDEVQQ
jgi:hypothetical protein